MHLAILYRNDAEKIALMSVFSKVENISLKYVYFGNTRSVDEYKLKHNSLFAFLLKIFEVCTLLIKISLLRNLAFSTPHPSFRIIRFLNPSVRLFFYIRTLHIFEEDQSFSDRLSKKTKFFAQVFFFLNNYFADFYYSPGIVNSKFLEAKGVEESKILNVGLHPEIKYNSNSVAKKRIVIVSQAWDAHGFFETYRGEVDFITALANMLNDSFSAEFDIIIKLHPRERDDVFTDVNKSVQICRTLNSSLTQSDFLVGGLSSYLVEQYLTGVKVVFFVHAKATHYYDKPVKKYNIPVCRNTFEVLQVINSMRNFKYLMEKELDFLRKAAMPAIYITKL